MMNFVPIAHLPELFSKCLVQYRGKENYQVILRAFAEQAQALDDAGCDMMNQLDIATAQGYVLDWWGQVLGQTRGGMSDEQFRSLLYITIAALNSEGTAEDLIALFKALMGCDYVQAYDAPPACFVLQAVNPSPIVPLDYVRLAMHRAKAAGVKLELSFTTGMPAFGWQPDDEGLGDLSNPLLGGQLAATF